MKTWKTLQGSEIIRLDSCRSSCYLVISNDATILVDSGSRNEREKLLAELQDLKVTTINALILTRFHFDHSENTSVLCELYDCPAFIHPDMLLYLQQGFSFLPKRNDFLTRMLVGALANIDLKFIHDQPCKGDVRSSEDFDPDVFGGYIRILNTPGCSADSLSVIVDDEIALVGETMENHSQGKNIASLHASRPDLLANSWRLLTSGGVQLFLPSHGAPIDRQKVRHSINEE